MLSPCLLQAPKASEYVIVNFYHLVRGSCCLLPLSFTTLHCSTANWGSGATTTRLQRAAPYLYLSCSSCCAPAAHAARCPPASSHAHMPSCTRTWAQVDIARPYEVINQHRRWLEGKDVRGRIYISEQVGGRHSC